MDWKEEHHLDKAALFWVKETVLKEANSKL